MHALQQVAMSNGRLSTVRRHRAKRSTTYAMTPFDPDPIAPDTLKENWISLRDLSKRLIPVLPHSFNFFLFRIFTIGPERSIAPC